jgi:hypothetical protein
MFVHPKNSAQAMSHLRRWSLAWHSRMVLCWHDRVLNGPVDASNYEVAVEEFQMAVEAASRFWEAPQDLCIVELGVS